MPLTNTYKCSNFDIFESLATDLKPQN